MISSFVWLQRQSRKIKALFQRINKAIPQRKNKSSYI